MSKHVVKNFIKGAWKSWTVWFGALLAVAPDVLPMIQANWTELGPFIPDFLQANGMRVIGAIIVVLRIKSKSSLAAKTIPVEKVLP